MDNATHILGIDIAKLKFDIALVINGKVNDKTFKNTNDGLTELTRWLEQQHIKQIHACMEATGIYWEALAAYLADRGHIVSVVNPAQIAAYGKSILQRGKTDIQDARLIARFCERERPETWQPAPIEQRQLLQWVRQLQHLNECHQAESNRLDTCADVVRTSIQAALAFFEMQIKEVSKQIDAHIDNNPDLKHNRELLDTIPGVGAKTAPWLLAYFGDGTRFGRGKQAAAFAGLSPCQHQSGSSVNGQSCISKKGHTDLRRILFMPALATYGRKKAFVPFVERLQTSGKRPKEIIVALMRKIITIAQAVLKSQTAFNPILHAA